MAETIQGTKETPDMSDLNSLMVEIMGLRAFTGGDTPETRSRQKEFDQAVKVAHDLGESVTPYLIYVEDVDIRSTMIDPTEF